MDYSTKNLAKKIGKTPQTVRNAAKKLGIVPAEMPNGVLGFSFEQAAQICSYYGVELQNQAKEVLPLPAKAEEAVKEQVKEVEPHQSGKDEDKETIGELQHLLAERQNALSEKKRQVERCEATIKALRKEVEELNSALAAKQKLVEVYKAVAESAEKSVENERKLTETYREMLDSRSDETRQLVEYSTMLVEQLIQANQAIVAMSTVQAAALAPVGKRTFGQRIKAALAAFRGENEEQA